MVSHPEAIATSSIEKLLGTDETSNETLGFRVHRQNSVALDLAKYQVTAIASHTAEHHLREPINSVVSG